MADEFRFLSATPLAARMRPKTVDDVVGQSKALGKGSALRRLVEATSPVSQSIILWGPPGTGKTTLANLIATASGLTFKELSAVNAGVKDVREVIDQAKVDSQLYSKQTVLFIDEIHRFSKTQQDALLPAVEAGWLTMIAATTENPSFSVIDPLLSRSLLVTLETLTDDAIDAVLSRALLDERGFAGQAILTDEARDGIISRANGDMRRALTTLEAAAAASWLANRQFSDLVEIGIEDVVSSTSVAASRYDRAGDQHYDIISAFIKSVRGSDADAAIHYLARMIDGGEDPRFIARRLIILAAEDIGLAEPQALALAVAAAQAVESIGMPEGRIPLAEVTIFLALAPKSNSAYLAINDALADVRSGLTPNVPAHLRSNELSRSVDKTTDYIYPHEEPRMIAQQDYADKKVLAKNYYLPKASGKENAFVELWAKLRAIIRKS